MVKVYRPSTLEEALRIRGSERAIPFAGGTDLMVRLRRGEGALPGFDAPVLFLDRCAGLSGISAGAGFVEIGAMTTLAALARSPLVHPALREAVLQMGAPALRNVATLGGNVCNASPAADTLPFLYAFDAEARCASTSSERTIPLRDLIVGPGKTALAPGELLVSVLVPDWKPDICVWRKVGTRRANALTKVSMAAFAKVESGRVARARIALGAAAPTVVRLTAVERELESAAFAGGAGAAGCGPAAAPGAAAPGPSGIGRAAADETRRRALAARASSSAAEAVRPIDDQRSTAEYRREVAAALVADFVERVLGG